MSAITNERFANVSTAKTAADLDSFLWRVLTALGSLKIAVAMFAAGTLMLLVGTLAQDEETIVDVKQRYFNSWIAYVGFDVFVPQTVFPHEKPVPGMFAMPGGATIGLVLLINLFAAKLTRFSMRAKGGRFAAGMLFTLLGFFLVGLVIVGAHYGDGLQGEPPFAYDWIWFGTKAAAHILTLASLAWLILWTPKTRVMFGTAISAVILTSFVSLFLVFTFDAFRIPDPGLRIVWQLTKSLGVGFVLLTGLMFLFGERGGNVLIHFGVGLLMVGQFIFGDAQTEERVSLAEGQKTTAAVEVDTVEFVIIDRSPDKENRIVAFDHHMIADSLRNKKPLTADGIPFSIQIDQWFANSNVRKRKSPPADGSPDAKLQGLGREWELTEADKKGGTSDESNVASAFYTLLKKEDQSEIGSYVASQWLSDDQVAFSPLYETIEIASKKYDLGLVFRRNYKDYSITLKDVVLEEYTNTSIPKDYSSYVTISDKDGNVLQDGRVWMNSPMRFRGETFYQSSYIPKEKSPFGVEQTVLQVVTNAGWLIPYVSCVLVGLGMLFHFGGTFARFAMKYERGAATPEELMPSSPKTPWRQWVLAGVVSFVMLVYFVGLWIPKAKDRDSIDYQAIGSIPVNYGGRVKPFELAGAEVLEILSNKPFALLRLEDPKKAKDPKYPAEKRVSASEWLFAVIMNDDWVRENPLIRIDDTSVTADLNLDRVASNRYSYNSIIDGMRSIGPRMSRIIQEKEAGKQLPREDEKMLDVLQKISMVDALIDAYRPISPPSLTSGNQQKIEQEISQMTPMVERLRRANIPAILPSMKEPEALPGMKAPPRGWNSFGVAFFDAIPAIMTKNDEPAAAAALKFFEIGGIYMEDKKDAPKINRAVQEFKESTLKAFGTEIMRNNKVEFENRFDGMNAFQNAQVFYLLAGFLALISYAIMPQSLRTISLWICIATLLFHTYAIVARIYISERPPVVSLYSAAVFIGWGMVLFCVVAEILFPIGVSMIVAAVSGWLSLQVAYGLDVGDTMPVLRAVLDTQFWLSTHVISVSVGYSATFFAGLFGIVIVIAYGLSIFAGEKSQESWVMSVRAAIPVLYRICYAVVCFGLFFSFVGTVLGGLWGDDSWGRFWGWDPKENGALMIVLWNALLLHARWDKLVGALGFSILAICGNIITAWSMFGTNQLGIGLHAYGAFEGDLMRNLVVFATVQLAFIVLGVVLVVLKKLSSSPTAA
jgi:ABC-type transport system involved in cytochrome c biogenesis permease subunit